MQKKIIALAIAGLVSGGAFAQSNVTITGQLDASVYYNNSKGSGTTYGFASNNGNSSRFAFMGTEALGGGLTAFFNLTQEVNLLTGGAGSASSGATTVGYNDYSRGAHIGLQGGFGRLALGRQAVPSYATIGNLDAFGMNSGGVAHFWGQTTIWGAGGVNRLTGLASLPGGATGVTVNNSGGALLPNSFAGGVGYDTPNFNGFQVKLFTTFGNALTGADFNDNGQQDMALVFNNGTIGAVAARNSYKTRVTAAASGTFPAIVTAGTFSTLGANYTAGPMKLAAGWVKQTYDAAWAAAQGLHDINVYGVSGTYTVGAVKWGLGYTRAKDTNVSANSANMLAFLADYSLSKRTDAYVIVTSVRNSGAAHLQGLWGGNALVATAGSSLNGQAGNNQSIAVGYRVGF